MTVKEQINNLFLDGEELSLKEIYTALPGINKNSIMGCINAEIKKGLTFERVGKGTYKLKEEKKQEEILNE